MLLSSDKTTNEKEQIKTEKKAIKGGKSAYMLESMHITIKKFDVKATRRNS